MKSIEEIKKEIDFAIETKKIDGIIENDCLLINFPKNYYSYIYYSILGLLLTIPVWFCFINLNVNIENWIFIIFIIFTLLISLFYKDYLVYDYKNNTISICSKLFKVTTYKYSFADLRNILEIGINNTLIGRKFFLPKESEEEYARKHLYYNLVYLDVNGKLVNFSAYLSNDKNIELRTLISNFCKLLATCIEIPCKICELSQKLDIENNEDTSIKSLKIIPNDINKEISNYLKSEFKLRISIVFLQILIMAIVMEYFLIKEVGFLYSFYYIYIGFEFFFTRLFILFFK